MHSKGHEGHEDRGMYARLAAMIAVSFVWMYAAMFAMVYSLEDAYQNLNFVYMAGLMAGAMIPLELVFMRAMYPDTRLNVVSVAVAVLILVGSLLAIRAQAAVGDEQFVRSMIPHHSSAILMCRQAAIQDAQIKDLCGRITSSQQREIDEMTVILGRLSGK
jgi:uncharacterized protein (DUF305 family)